MSNIIRTLSLAVLATSLPTISVFGWSAPGHEAIAQAALQMLQGSPNEAKITAILNGESPADAAIWLDRIRENFKFPDTASEQEASAFKHDFHGNSDWHFCNFVVGSTAYSANSKYATTDDVVHALETAIAVLEGAPSKMSQKEALRCVIHLAGDIHQPLHCITGFFDITQLTHPVLLSDVTDPEQATQDRGGNQLMYTKSENLHHFWDLVLPQAVTKEVATLAADITAPSFTTQPLTEGDFHHWPEIWASASMQEANAAYQGITFKSAAFVEDPQHPGKQKLAITVKLPGGTKGYKSNQQQRAEDQLKLAALHLAQLLNKINFQ